MMPLLEIWYNHGMNTGQTREESHKPGVDFKHISDRQYSMEHSLGNQS